MAHRVNIQRGSSRNRRREPKGGKRVDGQKNDGKKKKIEEDWIKKGKE